MWVLGSGRARTPPRVVPYVFVSPFFLLFGVFGLFAIAISLAISFSDWEGLRGGTFNGLDNYTTLVGDPVFRHALLNTILLWLLVVPVLSFASLGLAWTLRWRLVRLRDTLRTVFFLPALPSLVVVGIGFILLLDPMYGLPNMALDALGLGPINLATDSGAAVPVLAVVIVWRYLGYNMVIHLAGLASLPGDLLDAARVDGAGRWQVFRRIVVPMSKRVLVFTAVLSTFGVFNLFDEAYVLFGTQGGPKESGLVLGTLVYREGFVDFNIGYAAAMSYVMTLLVLIAALIQLRFTRDES